MKDNVHSDPEERFRNQAVLTKLSACTVRFTFPLLATSFSGSVAVVDHFPVATVGLSMQG